MSDKYKVLIADDHPMARSAVRSLLEGEDGFVIAGEAANGAEAVQLCEEFLPDVVLMDIHMPGMSGLEAARAIKQRHPQMKVVMLTVSDDVADLFTALQYGAQGYLLKNMDPDDWIDYLRALVDDNAEQSRLMADRLFHKFRSGQRPAEPEPGILSAREKELLARVANGDSNKQIAAQLFISENTVKNHMKNMLSKLGMDNRVQLTSYAIRHGLSLSRHNTQRK